MAPEERATKLYTRWLLRSMIWCVYVNRYIEWLPIRHSVAHIPKQPLMELVEN